MIPLQSGTAIPMHFVHRFQLMPSRGRSEATLVFQGFSQSGLSVKAKRFFLMAPPFKVIF